ncbi:hypothetical protein MLD52_08095 [Puniceicoccaceae bacterium K14]|nr:hypothetical protein [Puniceicoccaceae bacterium K14]
MKRLSLPSISTGLNRLCTTALLLGASAFAPSASVYGNGEIDYELVAAFAENLDRFESELVKMSTQTDDYLKAYRKDKDTDAAFKAWVDLWESVGFHGVVETKAPYLYPPVWQGIYAMKGVVDAKGPIADMKKAAEQTKAALWQGLGGLRVLAANPSEDDHADHGDHGHSHDDHDHGSVDTDDQPVEAIISALESAVSAYADGDSKKAEKLVFDAYMDIFEGLEGDLIQSNADLVTALELEFNAGLPKIFKDGGSVSDAKAKVESMKESLLQAKKLLAEAEAKRSSVF